MHARISVDCSVVLFVRDMGRYVNSVLYVPEVDECVWIGSFPDLYIKWSQFRHGLPAL